MKPTELDFADAAIRLHKGREAVMALIFRGTLDARKDRVGRWHISIASIERLEAADADAICDALEAERREVP